MIGLLQRIRPRTKPRPRWRYARPGPHKLCGVGRRFFNQVSRTPFDCQAISLPPLASTVLQRLMCADRPMTKPPGELPWRQTFGRFADGPADARQLIGKRYDRDILMDAAEQTLCPPSEYRSLLGEMW
jgi:hypothetical protein